MKRQIFGYPILSWVFTALFIYWIVLQFIPEESMSDFVSTSNTVITNTLIFLVFVVLGGLWILMFAGICSWICVSAVEKFRKDFIEWRNAGSPLKIKQVAIQSLRVLGFPLGVYVCLTIVFASAHVYVHYAIYDFFGISATPPDINYFWNMLG